MKKMIALLALAFFGMTATCGMTFAAEANNGMATANEQALQDPATHQQKKPPHAVKNQEKKNAQHVNTKQQKKVTKKHNWRKRRLEKENICWRNVFPSKAAQHHRISAGGFRENEKPQKSHCP